MIAWGQHLIVAPVLVPLVAGAFMLLFSERRRPFKAAIGLASTFALLAIAIALMVRANATVATGEAATIGVYLLGNWPTPFSIVLVADRLSALMLLLTSLLACASLVFSLARWHQAGQHFHSLFQFLLVGVNGAFLTGDLFNLFVFFEVMLAASYGLALVGTGTARVRAGLHYIAINLTASMLFLIGVSIIYGMTGTLNMADLAVRILDVPPADRMLLETGAAILAVAFLIKAGMWPLSFWLPATYNAASAPVAAVFAILSKVGVYVILRLSLLLFGDGAGASATFGREGLLVGGMLTIAFGTIGVLASQAMGRLAGFSVLVSSGTLIAAFGLGNSAVTGGALFYLASSTLSLAAFFLLIELVERGREAGADVIAVTSEAFRDADDDPAEDEVGIALPATIAILGASFVACALLLAGLPPLSGFIAKFAMLTAMFGPVDPGPPAPISATTWALVALIVLSGLSVLIAMTRAGIRIFWAPSEAIVPGVRVVEAAPVLALLAVCLAMTVLGGPVSRYMQATAHGVHRPADYIDAVLTAPRAALRLATPEAPSGEAAP